MRGTKPTSIRYSWKPSAFNYREWARHFREKGWFPRTFVYVCDEPPNGCNWNDIVERSAIVHSADPKFLTLVTVNIDNANAYGVTDSIDILAPVVNRLEDKPGSQYAGNQRWKYDAFLAADPLHKLWWYD